MDFSFPKKEHLCLKRRFDELLAQGKSFFIYPYRVIYLLREEEPDSVPAQIAFAVRKKQFKRAVTRNLIRRRIRESWRHRKPVLTALLSEKHRNLYVLLVYGASEVLTFSEIDSRMEPVMKRLTEIAAGTME